MNAYVGRITCVLAVDTGRLTGFHESHLSREKHEIPTGCLQTAQRSLFPSFVLTLTLPRPFATPE